MTRTIYKIVNICLAYQSFPVSVSTAVLIAKMFLFQSYLIISFQMSSSSDFLIIKIIIFLIKPPVREREREHSTSIHVHTSFASWQMLKSILTFLDPVFGDCSHVLRPSLSHTDNSDSKVSKL